MKLKHEFKIEIISPFPAQRLPSVWEWMQPFMRRVRDDFGPSTGEDFVTGIQTSRALTFGILRDGELGGIVIFQPGNPMMGYAHVVFKKVFFGRRTTRPALVQVAQQLFSQGYQKICCLIFSDNYAMLALLEDLGAEHEGYFVAHTLREGQPTDCIQLRLTPQNLRTEK